MAFFCVLFSLNCKHPQSCHSIQQAPDAQLIMAGKVNLLYHSNPIRLHLPGALFGIAHKRNLLTIGRPRRYIDGTLAAIHAGDDFGCTARNRH